MQLPGIFDSTIFTRTKKMALTHTHSLFIRSMHPKSEIRPTREAIQRVLNSGWVGQIKIHGHRVQLHIPSSPDHEILAYNRHGKFHAKQLPEKVATELRRIFSPYKTIHQTHEVHEHQAFPESHDKWNVIDGEWLKSENKLFIFDFLKKEGRSLSRMTYLERYQLLPKHFLSPYVQILPFIKSVEKCMEILENENAVQPHSHLPIEGLVFKSLSSTGFNDTSIIRCRKAALRR